MPRSLKIRCNDRRPIVTRSRRLLVSMFRVYAVIPSSCIVFNSSVDVQRLWCTMRKHVMAAIVMKEINEINMATGEIVQVAPDGVIERWGMYPSECYRQDSLPENWEEFLAIRKMVIPANGWRTYPAFAWVWIDSKYNIGFKSINDTSWRISREAWSNAYDGTIRALVSDLHKSGKIQPLMDYVYRHDVSVYTTWSGKYELTIFHKGRKQWLAPGGWLGDKLLFMAAEAADVPDGKFYIARGAGKTLGQLIGDIESGSAYDEYWIHAIADTMLGSVSERRKSLEIECAWDEITNDYGIINTNTIELPDEILNLVSRFQKETGACHTACLVAKEALQDGYAPTESGILDWIRNNAEWFADHNISIWRRRAIEWLTKPTDVEAMSEPCRWPEYSDVYVYAYTPSDKDGNKHEVTVFLDGARSSMIKISDADGRNPQYFQGCDGLGYFSEAPDYISAWERGDLREI